MARSDYRGLYICTHSDYIADISDTGFHSRETPPANAKRLVDCWNACEGIENPAAIGEAIRALDGLQAVREDLRLAADQPAGRVLYIDRIFREAREALKNLKAEG